MYSSDSGNANAESYAKDNLISRYYIANSTSRYVDYTYDSLNRLTQKSLNIGGVSVNSDYSYKTAVKYNEGLPDRKYKTTQLGREILDNTAYSYYYDEVGNITDIKLSTRSALDTITEHKKYTYDNKNQLLSETITKKDANNNDVITTASFTYDDLGNITQKTLSGTENKTITYNYDKDANNTDVAWNHILTAVNLDGDTDDNGKPIYDAATETIEYDAIGNPTTYLGATLTWNGRQLTSYNGTVDGVATNVNYTYDANSLRSSKTVTEDDETTAYNYYYVGGQLRYETRGNLKFYYFYDASGNLSAIRYYDANGAAHAYFVLTNHQGDVVALYNNSGSLVATYEYDAWGNTISIKNPAGNEITRPTHIALRNPIRYRGYYYDSETGLYYLQSRYYNPQVGRFLNADGYITTGQGVTSYNMFAYCLSNPILFTDDSGARPVASASLRDEDPGDRTTACIFQRNVILEEFHNTVDITEKLDDFMNSNVEKLEEYKEKNGTIKTYFYFYENVKDYGALDIKLQDDWTFEDGKIYFYNGIQLRWDDPGNINYGYVGAVIFPEVVLCGGAGLNQITKYQFQFGDLSTFYDDPRDNQMIKYGYNLYVEGH